MAATEPVGEICDFVWTPFRCSACGCAKAKSTSGARPGAGMAYCRCARCGAVGHKFLLAVVVWDGARFEVRHVAQRATNRPDQVA